MKGKVQEQLLHIKYQYELELEKLRQGGKIEQTNVMTQSKQKEAAMKNGMLPPDEPMMQEQMAEEPMMNEPMMSEGQEDENNFE